jgi:major membrane immunogen (membrane-anchored lipoprotein)
MKRFAILFLVMILMLTACGESGITNTAHADETDNGDEYEDFNQEEGGIDDDAEPQIWLEEGVPYDNPTNNNQNDGWDGVDPNAPVDEKLDMSEIPEGLADGVIYYAHTTVGTIVIHDSAYIYRIVDGEVTQVWDYYAEADNVIFDASEYYENPHNRWYGYVGNSIVHFTEDDMVVDVVSCTEFDYSGMFMYCYHVENGALYSFSPCNDTRIKGDVLEIYTKEGHTFVRCNDGTYLLTVPPYLISQMSQQYCDEHPIPFIYLGNDDWYGYYMQLDTRNSGKSQSETTRDFDAKYGLTSVTWGYPTTNFSPMSVELAAGKSYQQVYDYYDIAFERDGGGYFKVGDIDFADSLGFLTYEFDGDMPSRVTWESYIASEEAFADIQQYLADEGYNCLGETNSGAGDKEYSYTIDGGYIMRVVYKNSEREGTHVFVYVDY